jgi:NNP family nitrate/nitrite transporter-like MFS transporter
MMLYGIIWVSLTLNYLTEVRQAPVMGERPRSPAAEQSR